MRFSLPFGLLVAPLLGAGVAAAAQTVAPRDPRIAYEGRVAFPSGDEARFGFPGIVLRFAYRGAAPTVLLGATTEHCYFNLSCNGWAPVLVHPPAGRSEFVLPSGEAPADGWVVELVRRSESWQGVASFHGLRLPPGCELLPPPPLPERRLLCIGDSITGGERIERMPPELDPTPRTANAGRAFGRLLGQALHAQVHLVSYGGRGIMRDWEGRTDTVNAPQFFDRTLPDEPEPRWDHRAYMPDVIIVCLGTNDFNPGLPDAAVYEQAYDRFVGQVRSVHPRAALLLAESPIFGEEPGTQDRAKRDLLRRCLDGVVTRRRAAGDARIVVAPLRHAPGGVGDGHPTAFQHEQIAEQLLLRIRELTGW